MPIYKDKSEFNIRSAKLLLDNAYFAPSVHCSYYSCIQYMLHILFEKQRKPVQEFEAELRSRHTGTHSYAISLINSQLHKLDRKAWRVYQKEITELKTIREESDYKPVVIGQGIGFDAYTKAERITRLIASTIK